MVNPITTLIGLALIGVPLLVINNVVHTLNAGFLLSLGPVICGLSVFVGVFVLIAGLVS